jgi:starch synthase (maltosyl-transferring)
MKPPNGRNRVVIEAITPQVDCARPPVCRVIGNEVVVKAVVFADGHDRLGVQLLHQRPDDREWRFTPMTASGNDIWTGLFKVNTLGEWRFHRPRLG